jgi:hypothetical protein
VEELLGGCEEGFPLAGALAREGGVAAGDQALAGEIRRGDLGEILLVEEAELEGPFLPSRGSRGRRAAGGSLPARMTTGRTAPSAGVDGRGEVAAGEPLLVGLSEDEFRR